MYTHCICVRRFVCRLSIRPVPATVYEQEEQSGTSYRKGNVEEGFYESSATVVTVRYHVRRLQSAVDLKNSYDAPQKGRVAQMQRVSAVAISGSEPGWVLGELAEGMLTLHFIPRLSNETEGSILRYILATEPALLCSLVNRNAVATYGQTIVCSEDEPEAEPTQEQIFTISEDF